MEFVVYPSPPTAPLVIGPGGESAPVPIAELAGGTPLTMFIRVVKIGGHCAASGPPHPTFRLRADTGRAVDIPTDGFASIFNLPAETSANRVASATFEHQAHDMYRLRVRIARPDRAWTFQIVNRDPTNAHAFTWVVADNDTQTFQPWIDLPAALAFEADTGQVVTRGLPVTNLGTGPLALTDPLKDLGSGFGLTAVPDPIDPNACAEIGITFTAPPVPGDHAAVYTATSNDPNPTQAGHNHRVQLTAKTRTPRLAPGTIVIADASGVVIAINPDDGEQTTVASGGFLALPCGIAVEHNGNLIIADLEAFDGDRAVIRVDPITRSQTLLCRSQFSNLRGLAIQADGSILVVDSSEFSGGRLQRVDAVSGAVTVVSAEGLPFVVLDVAVEPGGTILVSGFAPPDDGSIVRVDPVSRAQTVVTQGGGLHQPSAIALEADGSIVVAERDLPGVIRVVPLTGEQTVVSQGGALTDPFGVAIEADGSILATDSHGSGQGVLVRVDPRRGTQTLIAEGGALNGPIAVAVVPAGKN